MKKTILFAFLLLAGTAFTACSNDDDEGGSSSPNGDISVITTSDGDKLLLTSIGNYYKFEYDDQGRCTYMNSYNGINISYDPFNMEERGNDEDTEWSVSFTSEGYIKRMGFSYYYEEDDDYSETSTGSFDFSYDSNGRLTKISASENGKWTEDGDTESYSFSVTQSNSWSNGNLVGGSATEKGKEGSYSWTDNYTFTITQGSTVNTYNQFSIAEADCILLISDEDELPVLGAFIGLLGKASNYLPESYTYTNTYTATWEDDEEVGSDEESYTTSYTLNSDGTINTEKRNSSSYKYTYTTLGSSSSSSKAAYTRAADGVTDNTTANTTAKKRHGLRRLSRRARHQSAE